MKDIMKKIVFFMLFGFNLMCVFSFSKNQITESFTGTVCAMGNEPFVFPGILADDGRKFIVDASEKVKKEILIFQGKSVIFEGDVYFLDENQNKIFVDLNNEENIKKCIAEVSNYLSDFYCNLRRRLYGHCDRNCTAYFP